MDKNSFCKRVIYWGQVGPLCWFNAILMAVLYSQRSRRVILKKSKDWDITIEIYRILKYILKHKFMKSKNPEKDQQFFEIITPPKLLHMFYDLKPKYLPGKFKHYPDGYLPELYISKLYKLLDVDVLTFRHMNGSLYYDQMNHIKNCYVPLCHKTKWKTKEQISTYLTPTEKKNETKLY